MIIDRITENGLNLLNPRTAVPSPLYMRSFYPDPFFMELNNTFHTPNEFDGSGNFGTPHSSAADRDTNEILMSDARALERFQGVRVKNTVKELIMQQRQTQKVQQHSDGGCTALMGLLQGQKRTADCITETHDQRFPMSKSMLTMSPPKEIAQDTEYMDPGYESFSPQTSPDSFRFVNSPPLHPQNQLPLATGNSSIQQSFTAQQTLNSVCQQAPFAEGEPMSFFQWQIRQEEERLAALPPQMLTSQDDDGDTFLHIAVAQGRRALAYVLASKMANIGMLDMKEHNGQSALQLSVAANQHLIVQDLLAMGAKINTADCWGRSPLHVCAEKGHALTLQTIRKALRDQGQEQELRVEQINFHGLTPLQTAVLSHNAVVHELSHVASPQSPGVTELVQKRKLLAECVNTLLLMGASFGTKDHKSGRTCLHMACEEANVELLRIFLDQPDSLSFVNVKAFSGNTALHIACAVSGRLAQTDAVKLLMRRGADPSAMNLEKDQPAQLVPKGPLGDQVRRILKGTAYRAQYAAK
ncbi:hypothetical protein UPYG_G00021510 [Umbra pygmaea]|uniref:OCA domain-containing protein n=1 Tax=Umbra pygmaea TaxID=75934 RepID=A0ABD0XKY2_UMBPY